MDHETSNRLPEIVDYLRANPTPPETRAEGGQHVHVHHHYAAPAPPPPPPRATVMDQLPGWIMLLMALMIVATVCTVILLAVGIILVVVLVALALVIGLLAYLVRSMNEGQAVKALADQGRKTRDRTRSRRPY